MSSRALDAWESDRADRLDYMENLHRLVGGAGRGRRFTTEQINHVYVVTLSGEFQAFCRDLHNECSGLLTRTIQNAGLRNLTLDLLSTGLKLSQGNANASTVGSDFGRFGLKFWDRVNGEYAHGTIWQTRLEQLNGWRNAVVHQDFSSRNVGAIARLTLPQAREWRRTCNGLARAFDRIMRDHLAAVIGQTPPW